MKFKVLPMEKQHLSGSLGEADELHLKIICCWCSRNVFHQSVAERRVAGRTEGITGLIMMDQLR